MYSWVVKIALVSMMGIFCQVPSSIRAKIKIKKKEKLAINRT